MTNLSGNAQGPDLVVLSTISVKEALIELVPQFEHLTGYKVSMTSTGAPVLIQQIRDGRRGDLFIGPEEYSAPLFDEGILVAGSRIPFARSTTGLAVLAGTPPPDISAPAKLKSVLLAARSVSFSEGASGMMFVNVLEQLGIAAAINAKFVAPRPGEMIGAVVARGAADIAIQQLSALLPVPGIKIVGPLPDELQKSILYGTHVFAQAAPATQEIAVPAFVNFLRSDAAMAILRRNGLEPA